MHGSFFSLEFQWSRLLWSTFSNPPRCVQTVFQLHMSLLLDVLATDAEWHLYRSLWSIGQAAYMPRKMFVGQTLYVCHLTKLRTSRMLLTSTVLLSLCHSPEFPVLLWWWISSLSGNPSCHDLPSIHHSTHHHCFHYRDLSEIIPRLHVTGMYVLHGLKQTCRTEGEITSSFSNITILEHISDKATMVCGHKVRTCTTYFHTSRNAGSTFSLPSLLIQKSAWWVSLSLNSRTPVFTIRVYTRVTTMPIHMLVVLTYF